jgi:hypothetical protein
LRQGRSEVRDRYDAAAMTAAARNNNIEPLPSRSDRFC